MLYITSLVLDYLITGSLNLLIIFIQLSLPWSPHLWKSQMWSLFLSFCLFACWSVIDLNHYVSSWCTIWWFDISIHYKIINMISLVTICHHTKILHYFWLYIPHTVHFIPMTHLLCNWKFVPLNLCHLFLCLWFFLIIKTHKTNMM